VAGPGVGGGEVDKREEGLKTARAYCV
jgi:hypothetical protein